MQASTAPSIPAFYEDPFITEFMQAITFQQYAKHDICSIIIVTTPEEPFVEGALSALQHLAYRINKFIKKCTQHDLSKPLVYKKNLQNGVIEVKLVLDREAIELLQKFTMKNLGYNLKKEGRDLYNKNPIGIFQLIRNDLITSYKEIESQKNYKIPKKQRDSCSNSKKYGDPCSTNPYEAAIHRNTPQTNFIPIIEKAVSKMIQRKKVLPPRIVVNGLNKLEKKCIKHELMSSEERSLKINRRGQNNYQLVFKRKDFKEFFSEFPETEFRANTAINWKNIQNVRRVMNTCFETAFAYYQMQVNEEAVKAFLATYRPSAPEDYDESTDSEEAIYPEGIRPATPFFSTRHTQLMHQAAANTNQSTCQTSRQVGEKEAERRTKRAQRRERRVQTTRKRQHTILRQGPTDSNYETSSLSSIDEK